MRQNRVRLRVRAIAILSMLTIGMNLVAQTASKTIIIDRALDKIIIDGELNEQSWRGAPTASEFSSWYPQDSDTIFAQTSVQLVFDEKFLYVSIVALDEEPYLIQSLKRDVRSGSSDGVAISLDPMNQKSNGYFFMINPYNVQADDQLIAGKEISFDWDNVWHSQTKRLQGKWVAEIAIPFKSIRYDEHNLEWGINFLRVDMKNYQYSTWNKVPVNFQFFDFGYMGKLVWASPPPSRGINMSFNPYVLASVSTEPPGGTEIFQNYQAGFDTKLTLSSDLNLDLSVNPDFSQADADVQVTNLTRFDIFFPERRSFFLENDDIFSNYGTPMSRPYYSRRIGLDRKGRPVPILAGLRLTGNLSSTTRVGIMNVQTGRKNELPLQNYTAVSLSKKILDRSFVNMYINNRSSFARDGVPVKALDKYGRNVGVELKLSDKPGRWSGEMGLHKSFKDSIISNDYQAKAVLNYDSRKFKSMFGWSSVGRNYYTDMGFQMRVENYDSKLDTIVRAGFDSFIARNAYTLFPKHGRINSHQFSSEYLLVINEDGELNEKYHYLDYTIGMKSTSVISLGIFAYQTNLLVHTSLANGEPLPPSQYNYQYITTSYFSDLRNELAFNASFSIGEFYNGNLSSGKVGLTARFQPWGNMTIGYEENRVRLPGEYGKSTLRLVSSKFEINFSNKLFWTTFLQYNTQQNNFNVNSRIQWRYHPMSDLFLVYTDNYIVSPMLRGADRSFVLKLNYWLH